MLGAALDPLAELWVHVFAYNGDFDAFAACLGRYEKGAEEAQLMYAMDSLRERVVVPNRPRLLEIYRRVIREPTHGSRNPRNATCGFRCARRAYPTSHCPVCGPNPESSVN